MLVLSGDRRDEMAITDYDRQVVIWCPDKSGELLNFKEEALALNEKAATKAAAKNHKLELATAQLFPNAKDAVSKTLAEMLEKLTDKSRLYICAHGSFGPVPKIVCWDGEGLAALLKQHGLKHAKLINLVSCEMGRDYHEDLENYIIPGNSSSFAAQFHQALKDGEPELLTEVRAYTWFVGTMREKTSSLQAGAKAVTAVADPPERRKWLYKPEGYKISFYWENGKQRRRYMNKGGNSPIDDE